MAHLSLHVGKQGGSYTKWKGSGNGKASMQTEAIIKKSAT